MGGEDHITAEAQEFIIHEFVSEIPEVFNATQNLQEWVIQMQQLDYFRNYYDDD